MHMSSAKRYTLTVEPEVPLVLVTTVPQLDFVLAGALFRKECCWENTICQALQSRD